MNLPDNIEALLFVSDAPQSLGNLATALAVTEGQVEQALEVLERRLSESGSIQIVKLAGGYQLSTKPEFADLVANFLRPQPRKLGRSLLEVLAVVAYRQPVTMAEVEEVRGVQSDYAIRALVERRLLKEVGRRKTPGRPVLYGTTLQFLHEFQLNSISDLPQLSSPDALATVGGLFSESQENDS